PRTHAVRATARRCVHVTSHEIQGQVSLTALLIAQARARETLRADRLFDDPLAAAVVEPAGGRLGSAQRMLPAMTNTDVVNRWRTDYVAVRTRFGDGCALDACAAGCRQVVLLAAGLDARAFRLTWPAGVRLFELDLPEVMAFKERVLAARG